MGTLIEVEDLHKIYRVRETRPGRFGLMRTLIAPRFRQVHAVDGVSFTVDEGELVGYLGPNGAGKSTTVKMLTGILVPTAGAIHVGGLVPWRSRHDSARQMGVVFGQRTQLYWDVPLIDTFELLRALYAVPAAIYRANLAQLRSLLELDAFLHTPVRQLSLGQRMRGDLAAALLHNPVVLFLDEPTIGLDFVAKQRVVEMIREVNRMRGVTVLLTTHNLAEVEELCPRILLIDRGRVLYDGTVDRFKQAHAPHRTMLVQFRRPATPADLAHLTAQAGVEHTWRDATTLVLHFPRDRSPADLLGLMGNWSDIRDLSLAEPSLEDVLRAYYARDHQRAGVQESELVP